MKGLPENYHIRNEIYSNSNTGRSLFRIVDTLINLDYSLKVFELNKNKIKEIDKEIVALNRLPFGLAPKCHRKWFSQDKRTLFILIDWVEGKSLYDLCKNPPLNKQDIMFRLNILEELATSISKLNKLRVIHRDLKPQNIIVRTERFYINSLYLIDFGLSSQSRSVEEGSHNYRSPEQYLYRNNILTPASDIYSFCQIGWFLMFGRPRLMEENFDNTDWDETESAGLSSIVPNKIPVLLEKGMEFNAANRRFDGLYFAKEIRNISQLLRRK